MYKAKFIYSNLKRFNLVIHLEMELIFRSIKISILLINSANVRFTFGWLIVLEICVRF